MSQGQQQNCRHQGCNCQVPAGKEYCSEHCERAAQGQQAAGGQGQAGHQCGCGHPGCA
jgi:hypothetical protein